MKERPIIFSGPMVRALLDGRKTQTRRTIKPQPEYQQGSIAPQALRGEPPKHLVPYFDAYNGGPYWCWWDVYDRQGTGQMCPYGVPGDRLWVKETWRPATSMEPWDLDISYRADGAVRTIKDGDFGERDWTMPKAAANGNVSPLFMPRWASRLTLEITDIRVERLEEISDEDAEAEGARHPALGDTVWAGFIGVPRKTCPAKTAFAILWMDINGRESWDANPWVWAVSFKVLEADQ